MDQIDVIAASPLYSPIMDALTTTYAVHHLYKAQDRAACAAS